MNNKVDFPIFKNNPELVYLDSAATSQKPETVTNAVRDFYEKYNSNIHRGIYTLSQTATDMYENAREKVAKFINANSKEEIVFTKNTNESINLAAVGWAKKFLKKGDIVVLSEMEHHANIVPWLRLKKEIGIEIAYLSIDKDFKLNFFYLKEIKKIKFVALTHASNVLGTVNPIKEIIAYFKTKNPDIKFLIDAAQSVPHLQTDVQELGCDFLAFSSHKMLGPSGVGILWAKKELLLQMDPLLVGSHMINTVTKENVIWADIPDKFEVGTANIEGVIGLSAAIDYLTAIGMKNIEIYEKELTSYALEKFNKSNDVKLFGPKNLESRIGVFSFAIGNVHGHDAAEILNRKHIAVRSGHHCAQPLMKVLGVSSTARASLYLYNTKEDIDKLFDGIEEVKKVFYD